MANDSIRGIAIELGADTSDLGKAIGAVEKQSYNLTDELKQVEKALKFDPSNVTLLAQKQEILTQNIDATAQKLETLKTVQSQVQRQFESGDITAEQYRAFQREIQKTESYLNHLKSTLKNSTDPKDVNKLKDSMDDLSDSAESAGSKINLSFKGIGTAVAAGVAGITGLVASTADLNRDLARLETNANSAGLSMDSVNNEFTKVASVSGEADSAVETLSNLMATGFSEEQLSTAIDNINGAAIKFSDTLKTEGIADGLQETFATGEAVGQFGELLERSGVSLDTFNAGLAQAKKNGTETDYVLQQMASLGLADTYAAYQENNSALADYNSAQVGLQMALAGLGERLMPLVTLGMEFTTMLVDWANKTIDLVKGLDLFGEGISSSLPQLLSTGVNMVQNIIQGITNNLPMITQTAITLIMTWLENMATMYPLILEAGVQILASLISGIAQNLPLIIDGVLQVVTAFLDTLLTMLPVILESGISILNALVQGVLTMLPQLIETAINLITTVVNTIVENLPFIIESGIAILNALIDGILEILPQLIPLALSLLQTIIDTVIENLPKIIESGIELLLALIDGIVEALPQLISTALELIIRIAAKLIENLPKIIAAGIEILFALIDGLIEAIPDLIAALPQIIDAIFETFAEIDWAEIGKDIIKGLISGISSMTEDAIEAISGVVGGVIDKAKSLLDSHSPSRVFIGLGEDTNQGYINGIEATSGQVTRSIEGAYGSIANSAQNMLSNNQSAASFQFDTNSLVNGISNALQGANSNGSPIVLQVNLDGYQVAQATYNHVSELQNLQQNRLKRFGV